MPKPSNLYQRNGVYHARVQVAGEDVRKSLKTKNLREAKERLKLFLEERSVYHGSVRQKFDDVMDAFLRDAASHVKPKTLARYEVSAMILAETMTGKWWSEIDKDMVIAFVDARKEAGVKIPTIKRDLTVLSQAAEWAIEHRAGGVNPVRLLGKRQFRHTKWRFVRPPEQSVEATIRMAYGNLGPLARFLLATGMRLEEGSMLAWQHVDLKRRSAMLYQTKSGLPRAVSLNEAAMRVLAGQDRKARYVFPAKGGEPYVSPSTNWQEAKARAQKSAQKEGWRYVPFRLHDLRHMFAIDYLLNGGNLYALQKQLGHSTIRQTEEYLDYLTPEEAEAVRSSAGTKPGTELPVSALPDSSEMAE